MMSSQVTGPVLKFGLPKFSLILIVHLLLNIKKKDIKVKKKNYAK